MRAASATLSASSFHTVEISNFRLGGEVQTELQGRTEIYYSAPDRARVISQGSSEVFEEVIIIGGRAWTRDGRVWSERDADAIRSFALGPINVIAVLREGGFKVKRLGRGPTIEGECTRMYSFENPDFGNQLRESAERATRRFLDVSGNQPTEVASLLETFNGAQARSEIIVGEKTGHIYSIIVAVTGTNLSGESLTLFSEYGRPVLIDPPR